MILTITPSFAAMPYAERLTELKKSVTKNVNQFVKCVKGHKDCSQSSQRTARVTLALLAALGLAATGKLGTYIFQKQRAKEESLESLLKRKNEEALGKKTSQPILPQASREEQTAEILNVDFSDQANKTPLMLAVINNNQKTIQNLINTRVNINARDSSGFTALHYAITRENPNIDVINLLITNGAQVNSPDTRGTTPLIKAVSTTKNNTAVIHALLQARANINAQNNSGNTPLYQAVVFKRPDVVTQLINEGADLNIPNNQGETPLMIAVRNHLADIVRILLRVPYIDIFIQNFEGKTASALARQALIPATEDSIIPHISSKKSILHSLMAKEAETKRYQ